VVPGTTWVQVSSGQDHTCATRSDGTLWCWGLNSEGRLGDGTTTNRLSPVQVVPGTTWAWVAGSQFHTCATRSDGTLWCWGKNDYGQLGDGTTTNRLSPVQVGTETTWARVAAGDQHSCATKKDGTLWCWGYNLSGQVGDNTGSMCLSPAEGQQYGESCLLPIQVGTDSGWDRISAGVAHTCATRTDGSLWCWGYSGNGQLGLGDAVLESHTPAMVTLPAK
jgi:alpha-tubulin suppressor-like RCC1 family protein